MNNGIVAQSDRERKKTRVLALAKLNAHTEVLLAMSDLAGITLTTEQRNYLRGPVMHSNSPWATSTPFWLTENVRHARLTQIFAEGETPYPLLATPLEVTIVMSAVAFEHPMHGEWVNVMTWAAHQAYKVYGPGGVPDSAWGQVAPARLTRHEQEQYYHRLAADIRAKAVKNAPKSIPIKKRFLAPTIETAVEQKWVFDPATGGIKLQ